MQKEQNYIFILGHMRSYSTLLSHILGSHADISGYTELHQLYASLKDFHTMKQRISFAYEEHISSPFLLDKILHNQYKINTAFLQSPQTKLIFLIRQPEATMKSIIQMAGHIPKMQRFREPNTVLHYYEHRLLQLNHYVKNTQKEMLFVEGERLIEHANSTLFNIQSFLDLNTSLSTRYSAYKLSGQLWYGDNSPEIGSGQISTKQKDKEDIFLPPHIIDKAKKSYEASKLILMDYCQNA